MPNIMRRPMFRRGGSSQGTGITSGLDRQNFQGAGPAVTDVDRQKAIIDYVYKIKTRSSTYNKTKNWRFLNCILVQVKDLI